MKPSSFAILTLIHLALPHHASTKVTFSKELVNQILQVIIREALDPYEDLTLEELMDEVRSFTPYDESKRMEFEAREVLKMLDATDHIHDFIKAVVALLNHRDEDTMPTQYIIDRRSPLGQYIRRTNLAFQKIPFEGVSKLQLRLSRWCRGDAGKGVEQEEEHIEIKPLEYTQETRTKAFEAYRAALASGDYTKTISSLEKFFAYQFPRQDRGLHQHALLNMASFHLQEEEYPACRRALNEAIKIARSAGDKSCLETCMSLLRRLDAAEPNHASSSSSSSSRPTFEDLASLSALDQLWELKDALRLGDPLPTAFHRLYLALGKQESELHPTPPPPTPQPISKDKEKPSVEDTGVRKADVEEGAWHGIWATLWSGMGEETLAEFHEDITLTSSNLDPESRLSVIQSRATRLSRSGAYRQALTLLFLPSSVASLSLHQYRSWAGSVWKVLSLQARRKDQRDVLVFLDVVMGSKNRKRLNDSEEEDEEEAGESEGAGVEGDVSVREPLVGREKVEVELRRAKRMMAAHQPTSAMPDVLSAMEVSRSLGLHALHRLTVLMLADVSLDMGMAEYAEGLVDEVYGQVIISQDEELKGYCSLTKARAMIVRAGELVDPRERASALLPSLPHLLSATTSYALIALYPSHLHALRLRATVLDALGGPRYHEERDEVALEWARVEEEWRREHGAAGGGMKEVWECARGVMEVGVGIGLGRV